MSWHRLVRPGVWAGLMTLASPAIAWAQGAVAPAAEPVDTDRLLWFALAIVLGILAGAIVVRILKAKERARVQEMMEEIDVGGD